MCVDYVDKLANDVKNSGSSGGGGGETSGDEVRRGRIGEGGELRGGGGGGAAQQYFWEAFPAGASEDLRTTYLFTYMDAREGRPSLTQMFEDYWERLRIYQVYGCVFAAPPAPHHRQRISTI
jgi:hypothetical protein